MNYEHISGLARSQRSECVRNRICSSVFSPLELQSAEEGEVEENSRERRELGIMKSPKWWRKIEGRVEKLQCVGPKWRVEAGSKGILKWYGGKSWETWIFIPVWELIFFSMGKALNSPDLFVSKEK